MQCHNNYYSGLKNHTNQKVHRDVYFSFFYPSCLILGKLKIISN